MFLGRWVQGGIVSFPTYGHSRNPPMALDPLVNNQSFSLQLFLWSVGVEREEGWRRSKNLKWITVLISFLWVWDKTATVRCVRMWAQLWVVSRERWMQRKRESESRRGREREEVMSGQNLLSLHDCPNIVSFPASLSLVPSSSLFSLPFYFPHFSLQLVFLLSCVTFPLICPFSCKGNRPRYSLISGQGYQRLSSELGLIAGMLMTHRMGSWAPECRQWRWSQLCCPKPRLRKWPEKRERERGSWLLFFSTINII